MIEYVPLTSELAARLPNFGEYDPEDMYGWAVVEDGRVIGGGGIWWMEDRYWAVFTCERVPPASVHRMAILLLTQISEIGIDEVWALADPTIPKSANWIKRLGGYHAGLDGDQADVYCIPSRGSRH
jgi:hypothetical protein